MQLILLVIVILLGVFGIGLIGAALLSFLGIDTYFRHRITRKPHSILFKARNKQNTPRSPVRLLICQLLTTLKFSL